MSYQERIYRSNSSTEGLISFSVCINESDLFISASRKLDKPATDSIIKARVTIENYISNHPEFIRSLVPLPFDAFAPEIIKHMLKAASLCGVGPMAAVAGAVAEFVGTQLLKLAEEVIIENGGDLFINTNRQLTIGIFAGKSPLSGNIGIKILPGEQPVSICTSSAKIGHSLSFGTAEAVTIKSRSATVADAAATAICNIVRHDSDIEIAIEKAKAISGVDGVLIIKGENLGMWGDIEVATL